MNLTPHDVDGGHRKRKCEIETEKYSAVWQLSWNPRKTLQNAQKIQRIPKIRMQTSPQATRMFYRRRMAMSNRTIDRNCTLRKRGKERQFLT